MDQEKTGPTEQDIMEFAWRKGRLDWLLWPQQKVIYKPLRALPRHIQTVVNLCARQFGKSFLEVVMATEDCLRWPGYSVIIVGPTIEQTVDIVHQGMKQLIALAPPGLIQRSKSEKRWYVGNSELIIGGFDIKNATHQRGKRALKIYVEEVVDSNPDQYRESLRSDLGPMLTHSPEPQIIFNTTPPRIPDHPFITETIPEAKLNGAFFCYTIDDNKQLSKDQYEACVKRSGGKHTIEFRREYLCEIVRDTSITVIPDFEVRRHVRECELPQSARLFVSIDWGGTRDLTVALLHSYDFESDIDLIIDERIFPPNTESNKAVAGILEMERGRNVQRVADVQGQLLVDLTERGFDVSSPLKSDWQANVNHMNMRFSLDKIRISPTCKFLIQSCESGTLNKNKTDFERTATLGHCDALAALMYGLRSTDRGNPYSDGRQTYVDTLMPKPWRETADTLVNPSSNAHTFGPNIFKPKRFGSFK